MGRHNGVMIMMMIRKKGQVVRKARMRTSRSCRADLQLVIDFFSPCS